MPWNGVSVEKWLTGHLEHGTKLGILQPRLEGGVELMPWYEAKSEKLQNMVRGVQGMLEGQGSQPTVHSYLLQLLLCERSCWKNTWKGQKECEEPSATCRRTQSYVQRMQTVLQSRLTHVLEIVPGNI